MKLSERFFPGDLVEVRLPHEILPTLDSEGAIDRLPFMPEMIAFCGKQFRIARRVVKTCSYTGSGTNMRTFRTDDVVTLEGVRCSGREHDGCPKSCMVFWRTAWLRPVKPGSGPRNAESGNNTALRNRLKTHSGNDTWICQASQLLLATKPLTRGDRVGKCIEDVRARNCTAMQMAWRIAIWSFWSVRSIFFGAYAKGRNRLTPAGQLDLQPGESVQVKGIDEITKTLDTGSRNRGLYFSPDMRLHCGETMRVDKRLDKIIVDGTGEMKKMRNTVFLEGSLCSCSHVAFGGCARNEYVYWREIWLRRPKAPADSLVQLGDENSVKQKNGRPQL
jgi:hypothetical protein